MDRIKDLQQKMFLIILVTVSIFAGISIIENSMIGFPFTINIKWIVLGIISLFAIINSRIMGSWGFRFIYSLIIILVIYPSGWLGAGGCQYYVLSYTFLIMISITFIFNENTSNILIALLIITFMVLFAAEYYFPEIVSQYSPRVEFLDGLIQVPFTLLGGCILLRKFANAYMVEKEEHDKHSLELLEANAKLEYLANRDVLTEVYNRRFFDTKLQDIIDHKEHIEKDIYVILIDLDNFKIINDTYGHSTGDYLLCCIANMVSDFLNENQFISRWGGDEFATIFVGNKNEALNFMNKLLQDLSEIKVNQQDPVTISAGVTKIESGDNVKNVFQKVDEALYQSKLNGRNQYTVL